MKNMIVRVLKILRRVEQFISQNLTIKVAELFNT